MSAITVIVGKLIFAAAHSDVQPAVRQPCGNRVRGKRWKTPARAGLRNMTAEVAETLRSGTELQICNLCN